MTDTFFVSEEDAEYFQRGSEYGFNKISLWNHPCRVIDSEKAKFIILKIITVEDLFEINNRLFKTNSKKSFLIVFRIVLDNNLELLQLPIFSMENVLFLNYDLRDHCLTNDSIDPLRGLTMPSHYKFSQVPDINIDSHCRKYLFSFKGNVSQRGWFGCANVRPRLYELSKNTKTWYSYLFEDTSDRVSTSKQLYEEILLESVYGLVLHGDGRWSHRLIEVMGSGAIPVIVSDGLTLPFEQIADYSDACIRIPESFFETCVDLVPLIELLPKDKDVINRMRINSMNIYNNYFKTDELVCSALLQCASVCFNKIS
jgi:hypothetical protein